MGTFNRIAAQKYALKWALKENPAYASLTYVRGDCTNFVSQVMLAGGWPMVLPGILKSSPYVWWSENDGSWSQGAYRKHINPYFSTTWASASAFADFIENSRRASICARSDLDVGDIVQIAPYGERLGHTMSVTTMRSGFDGNEPSVSFHSRFAFNESLASIEEKYAKVGGHAFFYWKVADTFQ